MKPPDRILIIRPSALGDVCRSVPLAASLHAHWPAAEIDWLVNAPFVDSVRAHPAVTRAVPFDRSAIGRSVRRLNPRPVVGLIAALQRRHYDIVIDAQGLARSGGLSWVTRAPIRVGHRDAREGGWLPLTHRVPQGAAEHTVDRMLSLLAPLGVPVVHEMQLHAPEDCRQRIIADGDIPENPIVLAPTSIWPGKKWPIERFVELARRIRQQSQSPIVVVGGPGERDQCFPLLDDASLGLVDRVGRTSVGELMAIIERSRAVVANDSAVLHMAVGFGKPTVALFGPTDTRRVGPYGRDEDVLQHTDPGEQRVSHKDAQAGRRMMERITVDEAEAALLERL